MIDGLPAGQGCPFPLQRQHCETLQKASNVMEKFVFKTVSEEIPVEIDDQRYVLVTPSGKAVVEYKNYSTDRIQFVAGRPAGMKGVNGAEAALLANCMFKIGKDTKTGAETRTGISEEEILAIRPYSIVETLAAKAKQMGGIEVEDNSREGILKQIAGLQARLREMDQREDEEGN